MKKFSCFCTAILIVAAACALSSAQPPDTSWTRTYGGALADDASSLVQTADGGYVLAGYTYSFGAGNQDFWLVKANGNGDSVWSRTFGGPGFEGANTLAQTADGGFILAGFSNSFGMGGYNLWLVKTNANGNSSWSRSYGGPGWDGANCVLQTSDGGYLLGGLTNSSGAGDFDFWLLKTNGNGDSVWSRTFGGAQYEDIFSMQPLTGGYILAGRTSSYGAGNYDAYLVKTNSSGDSLWTRHYGGTGFETATAVQQTSDGGYIFAGITSSYGAGNEDFWLLKTNANGDSLWSRTFGGGGFDGAYFVRQTTDSGFAIAGFTESFGAGGRNFYLVKTRRDPVSSVDPLVLHPSSFILSVFPNPFNPSTEIRYALPRAGHVALRVFDLLGREVAVLKDGFAEAGTHRVTFDGSGLPSGIFFARLEAGALSKTRKLVLLK